MFSKTIHPTFYRSSYEDGLLLLFKDTGIPKLFMWQNGLAFTVFPDRKSIFIRLDTAIKAYELLKKSDFVTPEEIDIIEQNIVFLSNKQKETKTEV